MICKRCGNEYEGSVCPKCGYSDRAVFGAPTRSRGAPAERYKERKSHKKFWLTLLVILVAIGIDLGIMIPVLGYILDPFRTRGDAERIELGDSEEFVAFVMLTPAHLTENDRSYYFDRSFWNGKRRDYGYKSIEIAWEPGNGGMMVSEVIYNAYASSYGYNKKELVSYELLDESVVKRGYFEFPYRAYYTDGSYYLGYGYDNITETGLQTLEWRDKFGNELTAEVYID